MNKQEILNNLESSRENFLDVLEDLPFSILHTPGVAGDWSIKDILAHLSRWEAELIKLLWQVQQSKKPTSIHFDPKKDIDRINKQWSEEARSRPLEHILEDFHAVRNQTILRVEQFSERDLTDPRRYPWLDNIPLEQWIANDSYEHEQEHLTQIKAWLQRG